MLAQESAVAAAVLGEMVGLEVELALEVAQDHQGTQHPRSMPASNQSCKDPHCHRLGILHMWKHHPTYSSNTSCWLAKGLAKDLEKVLGLEPDWEQVWDLAWGDFGNQHLQNKV